jgi:hypothetical protein
MLKRIALSSVAAFLILGAPAIATARADGSEHGDEHRHHGSAPEPITVIGLALGAGGITAAGWAARRSSRKR